MPSASVSGSDYRTTVLEGESGLNARADTGSTSAAVPNQVSEEPAQTFTLNDALTAYGFGGTQVMMFFFCGLAWAGDGMEMMLLSYLGPELRCEWNLEPTQESWIAAAVFIGMMLGSFVWGSLSDAYGRRIGFLTPACFTALFGVASAFSPNYGTLLFFRTMVGFGIAGAHVAYTLFMEFLSPGHRGMWLTLIEFFWTLGSLALAGMAWAVLPTKLGWRGLVVLAAIPLALLMALWPFLKESPQWLLAHGKVDRAQEVLEWVAKRNHKAPLPGKLVHRHSAGAKAANGAAAAISSKGESASDAYTTITLENASAATAQQTAASAPSQAPKQRRGAPLRVIKRTAGAVGKSTRHMFSTYKLGLSTVLPIGIWFAVALGYYGMIIFNTTLQVQDEKCTADGKADVADGAYKDVFITTSGEVAGLVACLLLIDVLGRKKCLAIFLLASAIFFTPFLRPDGPINRAQTPRVDSVDPITSSATDNVTDLDLAMLFLLRLSTYAGFIVVFIYTPEVYPTHVRSYAFGLFNSLCRFGGLVAPFIADDLFEKARRSVMLACVREGAWRRLAHDTNAKAAMGFTACCAFAHAHHALSWKHYNVSMVRVVQSGVRATIGVMLGFTLFALLLSALLPFETKGRELAEDDADYEDDANAPATGLRKSRNGHANAADGEAAAQGDGLEMAHISAPPGRANPFHTDDVSTQLTVPPARQTNGIGSTASASAADSNGSAALDSVAL